MKRAGFILARFLFYFLNFFSKKVYFFMPKFWYIKKLLYLCSTSNTEL